MRILLMYERKLEQYLKSRREQEICWSGECFALFSRNQLIQEYINSFVSFEDTLSKANEGVEFYKKVI